MEQGKKQRNPEIDKLYQQVLSYRTTDHFKKLLAFVSKFRDIAPYNAMLVEMQKPGSVYVASAEDWIMRFDRRPKLGARPLVILMPFGPVSFVYELEDTEGRDVPDELLHPFTQSTAITKEMLSRLTSNLLSEGIVLETGDYGANLGGYITTLDAPRIVCRPDGKKVRALFAIVLNGNHTVTSRYTTIVHELGHLFCGHLYKPEAKWLPARYHLAENEMEFEAETVNWLICQRLGIENCSDRYLSGYLDANDEIPEISVDKIMKAAGNVEALINESKRQIRKELNVENKNG